MARGTVQGKAAKKKTSNRQNSRQNEDKRASRTVGWSLLLVTVVAFHFRIFFHVAGLDRLQLQRTGGHHFEVSATLGARDDLALVDLFLFHVQISFALRTKNHDSSAPIRCHS